MANKPTTIKAQAIAQWIRLHLPPAVPGLNTKNTIYDFSIYCQILYYSCRCFEKGAKRAETLCYLDNSIFEEYKMIFLQGVQAFACRA